MGRRSSTSLSDEVAALKPIPPVSSKAKDYSERPEEVVDELDDLRTRGIAKVLNKHFTATTKHLATEKAKADSALADLERRRAQTKAFVPSKGGELNPYDQMYVQLQQKRAECRRKEKETMMLYQRYVMKYGKSAKTAPLLAKGEENQGGPSKQHPRDGVKEDTIRSSSDHKGEQPGKSTLGTLDENSEINFSKFYEKQQEKDQSKEDEDVVHFMSALNKFMTVPDEQQETDKATFDDSEDAVVPQLVPSKDSGNLADLKSLVESPSANTAQVNACATAISDYTITPTTTISDTEEEEEIANDDIHNDTITGNNDDAKIGVDLDNCNQQLEKSTKDTKITPIKVEQLFDNEKSSHSENVKKHQVSPDTPALTTEAAAIIVSPTSIKNKVGMEVTSETPCFTTATVEGYDADDRSIISELTTANSAVTRLIMDEVETEMEDFIKNEMEAIKRMLDSEEDSSTMNPSYNESESSSIIAGDESVKVAMKAEAMALEMQKILDDLTKEDASTAEDLKKSEQSPKNNQETIAVNVYPYKFEPPIPGEEWYVHFDETYQKEFYVEKKSKRTQWDYPTKSQTPRIDQQAISSEEFLQDIHSVSVGSSRKSQSRRSSRRSLYRKQRKRRRARRLMMSSFALLCVLVTVFCWRIHHPDETFWGAISATVISLKSIDIIEARTYFIGRALQTKTFVIDQFEYKFTDRREREVAEAARLEAYMKTEKERKARERAAAIQKAKEEAKRAAKEKAKREEAARRLEREEADRLAVEIEKKRKQDEAAAEMKRKRTEKDHQKEEKRPWSCNIPFSYIVPRCRRRANTLPVYKDGDLDFLQ